MLLFSSLYFVFGVYGHCYYGICKCHVIKDVIFHETGIVQSSWLSCTWRLKKMGLQQSVINSYVLKRALSLILLQPKIFYQAPHEG